MKKVLLASVFAAVPPAAHAADLYSPPPPATYAPAVSSGFNWSGFYLGLNAGYLWGETTLQEQLMFTGPPAFDRDGFIGGGQMGYNFQTGPWVLGVEADIQYSDASGSTNAAPCPPTCNADLNWFGTVRGRAGYAFDHLLVYATGGWAYGGIEQSAPGVGYSSSETLTGGWTAGGGFEFGFASNWTAKVEYLYMDLGSSSASPPFFVEGDYGKNNIVRVGVNYLFN
jgi:outer membrane immunogenic protein